MTASKEFGKAFVPPVSETREVRLEKHQRHISKKTLMDAANGKVTTR